MKKTIMALFMSGIIMTTGIPVLANNCRDTSLTSGDINKTVNGRAIIPSGTQRRIRNTIKESGYLQCKLGITSAKSGVSGRVSGKWSPDCAGTYQAAN